MNIVILDCGIGNRAAIKNMLRRLGHEAVISRDTFEILNAYALIIPGVGAFDAFMQALDTYNLEKTLRVAVLEKHIPVLGICLGMQILFEGSEEGVTQGLGWIKGHVKSLQRLFDGQFKIPNIGWHNVQGLENGLIAINNPFYFVHSFHCVPQDLRDACAQITLQNKEIIVGVRSNNIFGVQFHPEKSHIYGQEFFKEFLSYAICKANNTSLTDS